MTHTPCTHVPCTPALGLRCCKAFAAFTALLALSACSSLGVKPWQRDLHARADMQEDAMLTSIDEHVYFSKEASSGGRSFAGGGCGCN